MTLHINKALVDRIERHAASVCPEECCGILIGRRAGADAYVERLVVADNSAEGDRRRSYRIEWKTLFHTVRRARETPEDIVGFYHSHPDGMSRPSARDRESAWAGHSYLIIAIGDLSRPNITSWRSESSGRPLERERIIRANSPLAPENVRETNGA